MKYLTFPPLAAKTTLTELCIGCEEFDACHIEGGDEKVLVLGVDASTERAIINFATPQDDEITDFHFNDGFKSLMVLQKHREVFQPANTGELLGRRFEGKSTAMRCGSHIYIAFKPPKAGCQVYKLNVKALSRK